MATASSESEISLDKMRRPAMRESYATPTPQTSFLTAETSPAQRVPWRSSGRRGFGSLALSLKS